jgi:hypothetical protein
MRVLRSRIHAVNHAINSFAIEFWSSRPINRLGVWVRYGTGIRPEFAEIATLIGAGAVWDADGSSPTLRLFMALLSTLFDFASGIATRVRMPFALS